MDEYREPILQFFAFARLLPHLRAVSASFGELSAEIVAALSRNAERSVALRKQLKAKDTAGQALVAR